MFKMWSMAAWRASGAAAILAAGALLAASSTQAGDVRHPTIPKDAWGTWALNTDLCATNDKSNIIIKEGGGSGPEQNCAVEYVVETAGANGPNYSAHMWCTDKNDPTKKADRAFLIIPRGDTMRIGTSFDDLKTYNRCPATN